jgi:hypothetical protein
MSVTGLNEIHWTLRWEGPVFETRRASFFIKGNERKKERNKLCWLFYDAVRILTIYPGLFKMGDEWWIVKELEGNDVGLIEDQSQHFPGANEQWYKTLGLDNPRLARDWKESLPSLVSRVTTTTLISAKSNMSVKRHLVSCTRKGEATAETCGILSTPHTINVA